MCKPNYRFSVYHTWWYESHFEYRETKGFSLFGRRFEVNFWRRVPKPYLDGWGGVISHTDGHLVMKNFEEFVLRWPDPAAYMIWCRAEQSLLQQAYDAKKAAEKALRGEWTDTHEQRYFW
jgi:hypothetical protein